MAKPILDDALWELIEPHLPTPKRRRRRYPGRKPVPNRVALKGILFVLRTSIPWEYLPREMGCSGMTCWRRLRDWQAAGVWERIRRTLLGEMRAADQIDWSRTVADSASLRALKGGPTRAPIPRTAPGAARNTTCSPMRRASRWRSRSPRRTVTT